MRQNITQMRIKPAFPAGTKSKERTNQPDTAGSLQQFLHKIPLKRAAQRILSSALLQPPRASLTVEAAAAVPIFLMGMVMLLSVLELYRMQALLTVSAQESAMRAGMYAYLSGDAGEGNTGVRAAESAAAGLLGSLNIPDEVRANGTVSTLGSSSSGSEIDIQVTYQMPVWFPFFPVPELRTANRGYVYPWTGWNGTWEGGNGENTDTAEAMVYMAENGSVYHTPAESITPVKSARGVPAGRFYMCLPAEISITPPGRAADSKERSCW